MDRWPYANRNDFGPSLGDARTQPSSIKYDNHNGQVYRETVLRAPRIDTRWAFRSWGSGDGKSFRLRRHGQRGAPSLRQTAITTVARNTDRLTIEALQCIPSWLARDIWKHIQLMQLDSLHAWVAFIRAFPDLRQASPGQSCAPEITKRSIYGNHRSSLTYPDLPLYDYFRYIEAPHFDFITHLAISQVHFSRAELVHLAKLKNLGSLYVHNLLGYPAEGQSNCLVDDGIVRAWSRCAADEGAFPYLRVLMLRNQEGLTSRCVDYLNEFPVLGAFWISELSKPMFYEAMLKADFCGWKVLTENDVDTFNPELNRDMYNLLGCPWIGMRVGSRRNNHKSSSASPAYLPLNVSCISSDEFEFVLSTYSLENTSDIVQECWCPACCSPFNSPDSESQHVVTAPPLLSFRFGGTEALTSWKRNFFCFLRCRQPRGDSAGSLKRKASNGLPSEERDTATTDSAGHTKQRSRPKVKKMRNLKGHSDESLLRLFQGI